MGIISIEKCKGLSLHGNRWFLAYMRGRVASSIALPVLTTPCHGQCVARRIDAENNCRGWKPRLFGGNQQ